MEIQDGHAYTIEENEAIAIKRIQTFKPDSLGFSGGKDSVVCDALMKKAGIEYQAFMNLTTVDPKIHVQFMKEFFPHVEFIHPEKGVSMYSLIIKNGLPNRQIRFCCKHLKEHIQRGTFVVFGVRWAEGTKNKKGKKKGQSRSERAMVHQHSKNRGLKVLNPIIDWTDNDVWRYIYQEHLPISPLYLPPYNFRRVGCIGCPMANKGIQKQFRLFPEYKKYYISAIKRRMENGKSFKQFQTPEQVFDWWISQTSTKVYLSQTELFCMDNG